MKLAGRKIVKSFLFILLLCLVLGETNRILTKKNIEYGRYSPHSQYGSFYQMKEKSIDVLFLGTSHSFCAFSPQEFYNLFQIRSYNLGCGRQDVWLSYYWLKEALRFQKPKAVVFETYYIFGSGTEPFVRRGLDYMKWSNVKKDAIKTAEEEYSDITAISFLLPNIRYHERWKEINEDDVFYRARISDFKSKGYLAEGGKYRKSDYCTLQMNTDEVEEIPEKIRIYLDKIVDLCSENDIDLIFVKIPATNWSSAKHNAVQEYVNQNNIEFYDFNIEELYEEMGYNFGEDSRDNNGHPNIWGAAKISEAVGKILQQSYEVDGIEDEQWEYSKEYSEDIKKECSLQYETDINDYLKQLLDGGYSIFISVKDEATSSLTDEVKINLGNLGLQTDLTGKYRNSYYAVISENEIQENISTEKLSLEGNIRSGLTSYSIISAGYDCGNVSSIVIDGKEYSVNSRGLNFVIYSNESHQVIDSVCFDTFKGLTATR